MGSKQRAIEDRKQLDQIIHRAQICRLGLCKDNLPYVLPVSFGYDGGAIYIHTAAAGKKITYFEANPFVCVEFEEGVEVKVDEKTACKSTVAYNSVIGWGNICELVDAEEKEHALNLIMRHYTGHDWAFDPGKVDGTRVWRIDIEALSGKSAHKG